MGSVLKMLQSLDTRLSGLERGRGQLRASGHLGVGGGGVGGGSMGKRRHNEETDELEIYKLFEFLQGKESSDQYSLPFEISQPRIYRSIFDDDIETIRLYPKSGRAVSQRMLYIRFVDFKFLIYIEHDQYVLPGSGSKRVIDERHEEFESIITCPDIAAVWVEIKKHFDLPREW